MHLEDDRTWIEKDLEERFVRYVKVHTTSDRHSETTPSTERQFDLARVLVAELTEMGVSDVTLTDECYVIARIPASAGVSAPALALLAHLDTAPDLSGENVHPQIHRNYDGSAIPLGSYTLDPVDYPRLRAYIGETLITTDGSTLLGADDKAGVAEIMTVARYLIDHPEIVHPEIEIVFTPDEEIGRGVDKLPLDQLHARFGYTLDGEEEGNIEAECFSAWFVTVDIEGYVIHPGKARGKMVNAVTVAGKLLTMLPQNESPEATDGAYGFYCPVEVSGSYGRSRVEMIVRDFDTDEVKRRVAYVEALARTLELAYPPAQISVDARKQYLNMRETIEHYPFMLDLLQQAIAGSGATPNLTSIRGGTDGARLTEMGMPTPNIFAGGHNFHGRYEWIPVRSMRVAVETVVRLATLWAQKVDDSQEIPTLKHEKPS